MNHSLSLLVTAASEQYSKDSDPIHLHRDVFCKSRFQVMQMARALIEKAQYQALSDSEEESEDTKQTFVTRARCLLLNYWELHSVCDEDDAIRMRAAQLIQIAWPRLAPSSQKKQKKRSKGESAHSAKKAAAVSVDFAASLRSAEDVRDLNLRHPNSGRTLLIACRDTRRYGLNQRLSIEALLQHGADPTIEDNSKSRAVQYYILGYSGEALDEDATKLCSPGIVLLLLGDKVNEYVSNPGCNLLHLAAEKLLPSVAQSLLTLGISAWNRDASGRLPVHVLCETLDQQPSQIPLARLYVMFQLLFQKMRKQKPSLEVEKWQADASSSKPVASEKQLLHLAAKMGDAESLRTILAAQPSQAAARVRSQHSDPHVEHESGQEQWPVHMAFEFPVKSEESCFMLLEAALKQSDEQSRTTCTGESLLAPLLIESMRRKYDRCIKLLLRTEDSTMLRHRISPSFVGLLASCTNSQQFKLLLPQLRRAGADVSEAFTIAAARGWTDCALAVMLDKDVDINFTLPYYVINERATGHHYPAWKPGSSILHAAFNGHPEKPKQLQQLIELLNTVLNHSIAATLDFSALNASGCSPLLSLARQCKDYPSGPFSPSLNLLLSVKVQLSFSDVLPSGICQSFVTCFDECNLLHIALSASEPYLFQRIMQDRRSTVLFFPTRSFTRMQIAQNVVEQIEKWTCSPRSKSRRRRKQTAESSSSSGLDLISASELLTLVRDRFFDYEAEICRVLDMHGMYTVLEDIVLQYIFDSQRTASCKVQLDELINESRNHLQSVFEDEADLPLADNSSKARLHQ